MAVRSQGHRACVRGEFPRPRMALVKPITSSWCAQYQSCDDIVTKNTVTCNVAYSGLLVVRLAAVVLGRG